MKIRARTTTKGRKQAFSKLFFDSLFRLCVVLMLHLNVQCAHTYTGDDLLTGAQLPHIERARADIAISIQIVQSLGECTPRSVLSCTPPREMMSFTKVHQRHQRTTLSPVHHRQSVRAFSVVAHPAELREMGKVRGEIDAHTHKCVIVRHHIWSW